MSKDYDYVGCSSLSLIPMNSYLVNPFPNRPWFLHVCSTSLLENTVGKGEIAHNERFLLFPTMFSTLSEKFLPFSSNLKLSSANSFNLEESKICRLGKGECLTWYNVSRGFLNTPFARAWLIHFGFDKFFLFIPSSLAQ